MRGLFLRDNSCRCRCPCTCSCYSYMYMYLQGLYPISLLTILSLSLFLCSCALWSRAQAGEGAHLGRHAAEHTESRTATCTGHRAGRSATPTGGCAACPSGDMRVHKGEGLRHATTCPRMSIVLHANIAGE